MDLFGLKKRDRVIDLTEKYRKQLDYATQKASEESAPKQTQPESQGFGFLGGMASAGKSSEDVFESDSNVDEVDERKKRLAKRLVDMTNKIEDLSNQIYHLQQRVEVLERKSGMKIE